MKTLERHEVNITQLHPIAKKVLHLHDNSLKTIKIIFMLPFY